MNWVRRRQNPCWASLGVALWLAGCGDPCRELSERVCRCEPNVQRRQACLQQVSVRASQYRPPPEPAAQAAGRQACSDLIDGCTCEALAAGKLSACGLTPAADSR